METNTRSRLDPTFPLPLLDLHRHGLTPCPALRTRGPWPAPPGVAIVGTRRADPAAVAFARLLAAQVSEAGIAVWSGGALGVDAAAHEGAMEGGGRTVVVCPSGLDNPYPKEHRALFERVLATGGTLVSPFRDEAPPQTGSFHHRNAVLAALTLATIVVQAGEKSGARSTARAARRLGRPLYVVPHAPWDERGRGCAIELVNGAVAIVSGSTLLARLHDELLRRREKGDADRSVHELMRTNDPHARRPRRAARRSFAEAVLRGAARSSSMIDHDASLAREHAAREHACPRTLHGLDAIAKRVLESIREVPIHMDDLCEQTALPAASVTAALLTLTLGAVVVEAPAGFYRLSTI